MSYFAFRQSLAKDVQKHRKYTKIDCLCTAALHSEWVRQYFVQARTKSLGLGRHEVKPVEQALVDDRSPNGLPKKPSCDKTGSSTAYD
jgi:hypothetical protein